MHIFVLSCSFCLFCFLSAPGLSLGLWDLVPWPGIEPGPLQCECRGPVTEPMLPLKLESWVEVIMLAGLSGSVDHLCSLNSCAFSGIPSLQHSFWKFTGLFTMWKQKSDTIPTLNCFQLIEEQVSKKQNKTNIYISYALSVLPLA